MTAEDNVKLRTVETQPNVFALVDQDGRHVDNIVCIERVWNTGDVARMRFELFDGSDSGMPFAVPEGHDDTLRDRVHCDACGRAQRPPARSPFAHTPGTLAIARERIRQIDEEGWTREHDDCHDKGELARAAVCYATPKRSYVSTGTWPWDAQPDKRDKHDRRRQLVIAGALIAAEIDRLDRKASHDGGES